MISVGPAANRRMRVDRVRRPCPEFSSRERVAETAGRVILEWIRLLHPPADTPRPRANPPGGGQTPNPTY